MAYLEYGEYLSLGGVCDLTAYQRNIDLACSVIDNATFNRVSKMESVPLRVKTCCRDLIEYYATNASVNEKNVTSWLQSAGTVSESVSYADVSDVEVESTVRRIIFEYLFNQVDDNGTPLLYKGAMS